MQLRHEIHGRRGGHPHDATLPPPAPGLSWRRRVPARGRQARIGIVRRACAQLWLAASLLLAPASVFGAVTISANVIVPATPNISQGDRARIRFSLTNSDGFALTNVTFTNTLPANVILYAPTSPGYQGPLSTCIGGTLTAAGNLISYTNGSLGPQVGAIDYVCFIEADVTSIVAPLPVTTYSIAGVPTDYTDNTGQNAQSPFSQSLNVTPLNPPTVAKSLAVNPLPQGNTTTVTLQIANPNPGADLPLTSFTDNLPANLNVVSAPVSSCGGAGAFTASSITLTGGIVPAGNPGICTLTFSVRGTLVAGVTTSGVLNNTINAGDVGNIRGLTNPAVSTPVSVNSPIRLQKSFSPATLSSGQNGVAIVTIFNDSSAPLTGVQLSDIVATGWPAALNNRAAPTIGLAGCGAADVVAGPGGVNGRGFVLGGVTPGTIAAGGSCVVTVPITSTTVGIAANSIPAAAVTTTSTDPVTGNPYRSPAASASVDVRDVVPDVTKTVSPSSAAPGDIVTFTVNVTTFNAVAQAGVTFTDTLPAGLLAVTAPVPGASAPTLSAACSNFIPDLSNPAAPKFTFDMPPAAAGGTLCTVTFQARVPAGAAPGSSFAANATGTIANAGLGINSGGASSGAITVLQPLQVAKAFDGVAARILSQGTASVLAITLTNNNFTALTNAAFTDTLPVAPGQLRVANPPNASSTCGGTFAPDAGDTIVALSGGVIPARTATPGTCVVRVDVVGGTVGNTPPHTNTIPAGGVTATIPANSATGNSGAATPVANTAAAAATLEYTPALTAVKTFLNNPITVGGVSRVRITLGNIGAGVLTNVGVTDPLTGAGLALAALPNAATSCGGAPVITAVGGGASASLAGVSLPAGGSCDFLFDVTSSTLTSSVNTIPPGNITASGGVANTNPVTATLTKVASQLGLSKTFNPSSIASPGQPVLLTITINNNVGGGNVLLTNVGVVDNLPAGVVIAAVPNIATTCLGGTVTAVAGGNSVTLSGAVLTAAATCQVTVNVTSIFFGTLTNTLPVGAVTNDQGVSNTTAQSANLAALQNLGVEKSFISPSVQPNVRSQLRLKFNNSLPIPLSNITTTDNLPSGLTVAVPPNVSTTCAGAAVTNTASTITLSGASLPPGPSSCTVFIDVVAGAQGSFLNVIPAGTVIANGGAVANPEPGPQATLNVVLPAVLTKAFAASPVNPGQTVRLTVTIANPNAVALTAASVTDTLPAGLFVAPVPNAATTCAGGVATAFPSGTLLRLTGASIPAAGSCAIAVDTVSNVPGIYTNTIPTGALTSTQGASNVNPATALVQVLQFPTVAKTFNPVSISPGSTARLTITLGNTNPAAQTLTQNMDDNLPANVLVAAVPNIGGTCPGLPASVTAVAGSGLVRYNNGSSIPSGGCTLLVDVTSSVVGVYPNTIPLGGLVTNIGPNPAPAQATLSVSPLGSIAGRIFRDNNDDGIAQPADSGVAGQTVELLNNLNVVIATTTTDANGNYQFTDLAAGTYSVREPAQPPGTLNGITTAGTIVNGAGAAGAPSGVGTVPSTVSNITLVNTAGIVSSSAGNNFAEIVPSVISGTVYQDDNGNGVRNGTEPGLAGVPITLSGVDDLGNAVTLNTTSDASGNYLFPNLRPSCSPLAPPTCPGYVITEGAQPGNTTNGIASAGTVVDQTTNANVGTPGASSNNAPAIGAAAPAPAIPSGTSRTTGIILPANAAAANNNFGELPSNRSISGRIFQDTNGDGIVSAGETGTAGQTLTLTGNDINGNPVSVTVTTDVNGNYTFANLPPGTNYTIACSTCPAPGGFTNSATPLAYPGTTGGAAGGTTAVPTITGINLAGTNTISANNNFTKVPAGALISGKLFFDTNNDGLQQAGEPGISGQTVELRNNGTNALIATRVTDASGNYSFTGLAAGTYKVVEPAQPPGTVDGKTTAGTINGVTAGVATAQGTVPSTISAIALGANQLSINNNFAETATIGVGGKVYVDANNNGVPDPGEQGIGNVTITLSGTDNAGNPVIRTTTTAADGSWSITGLPPSNAAGYSLIEAQPPAWVNGINTAGSAGGTVAGDVISGVVLASSTSATNFNFGERGGSLAGVVYNDANTNGTRQPGEPGVSGVTLTLTGTDVAGNAVNIVVVTAADGSYTFSNLPVPNFAGYTITRGAPPGGFAAGGQNAGSLGGNAAVAGVITGIPLPVAGSNGANYNFGVTAAGVARVSGTVYLDANHNRTLDEPAGAGRAGWTVELIQRVNPLDNTNYTLIASTTTDASGNYQFANLPAATYEIRFRAPGNNTIFGVPQSTEPGITLQYGTIRNLTLAAGANVTNQNLPLDPGGVIYDAVTRQPVTGAAITLNGPPGFVPANDLVGGAANATQVTGVTGQYQFLLLPTAPAGNYTFTVVPPGGYAAAPSVLIPPCTATLNVGAVPNPALIQNGNGPPALGTPAHVAAACPATSAGVPAGAGTTQYYYTFTLTPGVSANALNNHIPIDPILGGALLVQKTTPLVNVTRGDLVPYTIVATNTLGGALANVSLQDQIPPGFRYRPGTARVNGVALEPTVNGRSLTWASLNFATGERKTFTLVLVVGAGVGDGQYVNTAYALSAANGAQISNVATATVRIVPDPTFDCSDIIGKVFDDRNVNGYQDEGEPGLPNVRVVTPRGLLVTSDSEGRFHVTCADVPNADRGANFVMKLDERSLPTGYRVTTENPHSVRVTRGKMAELNFGAAIHRVVRVEVADAAFAGDSDRLLPEWQRKIDALPAQLKDKPSVVRIAYARGSAPEPLVRRRVAALIKEVRERWAALACCYPLTVEDDARVGGTP